MGRWVVVVAALAAGACGSRGESPPPSEPAGPEPQRPAVEAPRDLDPAPLGPANAVQAENALPGDPGWRLARPAAPGELEGYASAVSVDRGQPIDVHVRASQAHSLTWSLYRMGYYGGAEGRLVAAGGPVPVGPRAVPAPLPFTRLVECDWPATFTIHTDPEWISGVYLVKLVRGDGVESYVPFVLRDDARKAAAVVQLSVTTWQAYNTWGSSSFYGWRAPEISFDRPYVEGHGAGQYFRWEHDFVRWVEARGFDVVYVTGVDLDRDAALLGGQRLFLSVGHDEYWTRRAREAVEIALRAGVSLAFLSANTMYWHIRLEHARGSGAPRRTEVCYKDEAPTQDPLRGTPLETVQWRQLGEPENALLGVMYGVWQTQDADLVVAGASAWPWEGTGVRDGDVIPGLVGYECDRRQGNGFTPPATEVVARSPVVAHDGTRTFQESTVRVEPTGAFVFAAGTIQWSWGLSRVGYADARIRRVTENLFRRAGLEPSSPEPPLP